MLSHVTSPAGTSTRLTYEKNAEGRIVRLSKHFSDQTTVGYEFDNHGRRTSMSSPTGTVQYSYDDTGRLQIIRPETAHPVEFAYDEDNRRVSVGLDPAVNISLKYDFLSDALTQIKTPVGDITYTRNRQQNVVMRELPNGIRTRWSFNLQGQLLSLEHSNSKNGKTLLAFDYEYRPDGLIAQVSERTPTGNKTTSYDYDLLHQTIACHDSVLGVRRFEYDLYGNRTRQQLPDGTAIVSRYDWASRLIEHDGAPCTHESETFLSRYVSAGKQVELTYTSDGNVSSAIFDGKRVSFAYDGDGNLVARKHGTQQLSFLPDPVATIWRPLSARDDDGHESVYFWEDDVPIGEMSGQSATFYLGDQANSVRIRVDMSGNVIDTQEYDPFGTPLRPFTNPQPTPAYCGMFYDPLLEMYLTRHRLLDPQLGRFTSPDPQHRIPAGTMRDLPPAFVYCGNDPINFVDLDGAEPKSLDDLMRRQRLPVDLRPIVAQIANQPQAHFEWAVGLGWGSGALDLDAIVKASEGRFQVIHVTGSPATMVGTGWKLGAAGDSITLPSPPAIRGFEMRAPFSADHVVLHSGANSYAIPGARDVIRVGASRQGGLPYSEVVSHLSDPVPKLSGLHPVVHAEPNGRYFGVAVRVPFQGLRDFGQTVPRATQDAVLGAIGIAQVLPELAKAGANMLLRTQFPTFQSHNLQSYYSDIEARIPAKDTYKSVQIVYTDGRAFRADNIEGSWQFKAIERLMTPDPVQLGNQQGFLPTVPKNNDVALKLNLHSPTKAKSWPNLNGAERPASEYSIEKSSGTTSSNGPDKNAATPKAKSSGDDADDRNQGTRTPPSPPVKRRDTESNSVEQGTLAISRSAAMPSSIGGVYLGGAVGALDIDGLISGVTLVDGKVVLISDDTQATSLPPLRLVDIAQIFRDVYQHGSAAWVSIDPDPDAPGNSKEMLVRSGPGDPSYISWVLYICDRIMKDFSLGKDHRTGLPVTTNIDGYRSILDRSGEKSRANGPWVRYWIVPSRVAHRVSRDRATTLIDVPLEVRTQTMAMRGGKLVPAANDKAPRDSVEFAQWFTDHYQDLAKEVLVVPPADSGLTQPIPVFAELQRIATVTAVAEALLQQGIPLPAWMSDFPPAQCTVPATTPALIAESTTTKGRRITTRQIYGGVTLSVPDDRLHVDAESTSTDMLTRSIQVALADARVLHKVAVTHEGRTYSAVMLPGDTTKSLGACRLAEVDLAVPVGNESSLHLTRHFNSFFRPNQEFGPAWTLDLPYLVRELRPTQRTEDSVQLRTTFRLATPLNTCSASFTQDKFVAELNSHLPTPSERGPFLALASDHPALLGIDTTSVILRDGRRWQFNDAGQLVSEENGEHTTRYRRDENGRVTVIEAYFHDRKAAEIQLAYNSDGRFVSARSHTGEKVDYEYNSTGELVSVSGSSCPAYRYKYDTGRVSDRIVEGRAAEHFAYSSSGQLTAATTATGRRTTFEVTEAAGRSTVKVSRADSTNTLVHESRTYNNAMQLVSSIAADGTMTEWDHNVLGRCIAHHSIPNGLRWTMEHVNQGNSPDRLTEIKNNTTSVRSEYDPSGQLKNVLISTVEESSPKREPQMRITLDAEGRGITSVRDYSGFEVKIARVVAGRTLTAVSGENEISVSHDEQNQAMEINTSWGERQSQHFASDGKTLDRCLHRVNNATSTMYFANGVPSAFEQFDGGKYTFEYAEPKEEQHQLRLIHCPNGLALEYVFDEFHRPKTVTCGRNMRVEYLYDADNRLVSLSFVPVR